MSNHLKILFKPLEPYVRVIRNVFQILIILCTTKPNNLKAINNLHLNSLEIEKLKVNNKNFICRKSINADCIYLKNTDENSVYSQHGEDGITLKIINSIELEMGSYIELGAGGYSSNTQILAHIGWSGKCIDGSKKDLDLAKTFFELRSLPHQNTEFIQSWITIDNINELVSVGSMSELDLLSIDLDGIDYWLLSNMKAKPKIIVAEYNASFGPHLTVTIPYKADFYRWDPNLSDRGWYYGMSLKALTIMLKEKGYELVYCEESGVNAFFVRDDIVAKNKFFSKTVGELYMPDRSRLKVASLEEQISHVKKWELVNTSSD